MASIRILHLTSTAVFWERSPPGGGEPAAKAGAWGEVPQYGGMMCVRTVMLPSPDTLL